jgi:hypothetical protein
MCAVQAPAPQRLRIPGAGPAHRPRARVRTRPAHNATNGPPLPKTAEYETASVRLALAARHGAWGAKCAVVAYWQAYYGCGSGVEQA